MLEGDFGWNDVGSWDTLDAVRTRDAAGNISSGDTLLLDAKNCVVYGGKKLIAAVGVENLVIVEGRDSILVCPVDQAQRVKEVVETLEKKAGRNGFKRRKNAKYHDRFPFGFQNLSVRIK